MDVNVHIENKVFKNRKFEVIGYLYKSDCRNVGEKEWLRYHYLNCQFLFHLVVTPECRTGRRGIIPTIDSFAVMSECRNVGDGVRASLESMNLVGMSNVGMSFCHVIAWMILSEYRRVAMGCRYHYSCCNVVTSDVSLVCENVLFFIPTCRYVGCRTVSKYYRVIFLK